MPGNLAGSPALTFAPLDVPDRRQRARRFAVGDDAAALRGLQGRRGASVLPRSFLAARPPDRAGRCARRRSMPGRKRCTISKPRWPAFSIASGSAAARSSAACSGRGSIASCLPRPRPIICTIPAMTGSKPCCGARSPRPPTAPNMPAPTSTWSRWPRCAPPARRRSRAAATSCRRSSARPRPARCANGETFDGETEVATFPGDLPADPEDLFKRRARFAASPAPRAEKADFRFLRFRPPLLERDGGDEPALPHIRLDRALQFLIGDRLQ